MLQSKDTISEVAEILKGSEFYDADHTAVFSAILGIYTSGEPADCAAVQAALVATGYAGHAIESGFLQALVAAAPSSMSAGYYAEKVAATALRRRLIEAGNRIVNLGYSAANDAIETAISTAASEITKLGGEGQRYEGAVPLANAMELALDNIETISNRSDQMTGVPTGFHDLDVLTNGLQAGQLIVIAGRPSVGKSVLATDFIRSCSVKHGMTSVLFTLESSTTETTTRIMCSEARVALHHMRSGTMTDEDWARLARRMGPVSEAPMFIDDRPNLTFTHIAKECRRLHTTHNLQLAVVDCINGLPYGTRPFDNRYLEISEISRCLKQLAKELRIPIVATSQLNRAVEARPDKRPILSDLRDSGTLEENADIVVLLHREDMYDRESPRAGEADLILAKHRQGPTANITTAFQGHYSRFVDMAAS